MSEIIDVLPVTPANVFYFYKATVARVVDGDTAHLALFDFGRQHFEHEVSIRFCRPDFGWLDAWETTRRPAGLTDPEWAEHRAKGLAAKGYVESVLTYGREVVILTSRDRDGTFRDLAGAIFVPVGDGKYLDMAAALAARGHLKL